MPSTYREPAGLASQYEAVIFDADGVLVELTDWELVRNAVANTFRSFDVEPTGADIEAMLGATVEDVRSVCRHYDIDPSAFWYHRDKNVSAVQQEEIRSGRKGLYSDVSALDRLEHPLAVVSNNQQQTIDCLVQFNGMDGRFSKWFGRQPTLTDIQRKKPAPYYLRKTLSEVGTENAVYIGDSRSDVVAASRAGIDSAFIRRSHRREYELDVEPTYEIESLTALIER